MSADAIRWLVANGVLAEEQGSVAWPGDGSRRAIWDAWVAGGAGARLGIGRARFSLYSRVRRVLDVKRLGHPDCILLALIGFAGGRAVPSLLVRRMLGISHEVERDRRVHDATLKRLHALQGSGRKVTRSRGAVDPEKLFEAFPPETRARMRALLDLRREPPIPKPHPHHVGRVLRLKGDSARLLAACMLLDASVNRLSRASRNRMAASGERYDAILPKGRERDVGKVTDRLNRYAWGTILPEDGAIMRAIMAGGYGNALDKAHSLAVQALGADAHLVTDLLPGRHLDERGYGKRARKALRGALKPARLKREDDVVDLAQRSDDVLIAVENRMHQLEGILRAALERLPEAQSLLRSGLTAGFEHVCRVVRPDGTRGDTDQVVSFRFELESKLWTDAWRRQVAQGLKAKSPGSARRFLPAGMAGRGHEGCYHDPACWNRVHIVYEWTRPVDAGGECHEPHWVDLYRWRMLDTDRDCSPMIAEERRRRLLATGLPLVPRKVDGMLGVPGSRTLVARHALGPDPATGSIVVPLVELYHALSYGRIVALYPIRFGARFGETQQIRLGPECFRKHRVDGVEQAYLALKPKGWLEHGRFGLDRRMSDAIRNVKDLTIARWHPDERDERGRPSLPVVEFEPGIRDDLPPARYLFQCRGRALMQQQLLLFVRVLLLGVVDMTTHDGRYVFASLLGLDGVGYEQLGALLHHRPGSFATRGYDLSGLIGARAAADRHNARTDARLLGLVSGG